MKDRTITVLLSALASLGISSSYDSSSKTLDVDRLIVRKELIVSDTGAAWEAGFESQQIARGIYARPQTDEAGGLWVRGRLIKAELDDPFDDRFHAMNRDGSMFRAPGHMSWNVWLDGAWRQLAIVQGEGLDLNEIENKDWSGGNHPGRLRLQTFRHNHPEPLTDMLIGQGKMALGGGGFGGGGLPYPSTTLEVWGGAIETKPLTTPNAPIIREQFGKGENEYAVAAVGVDGTQTPPSSGTKCNGTATIQWDSVAGADAYVVYCNGQPITQPIRIEGSNKIWRDNRTKQ